MRKLPRFIFAFAVIGGLCSLRAGAQSTGDWQTAPGLTSACWDNDNNNSAGTSGTWQTWSGTAWVTQTGKVPGTSYPSNNVTHISIQSGIVITNSGATSGILADEVVVSNGAALDILKTTFDVNHSGATAYDLDVYGALNLLSSSSGSVILSNNATIAIESGGAMTNFCNTSSDNFSGVSYGNSSIQFLNGSLYVMAAAKQGYIPLATWNTGSTFIYAPPVAGNFMPKQFTNNSYGNFIWNWPLQSGGGAGLSGNVAIKGSFIIQNAGGTNVEDIPDGSFTLNVGGNIAVTNGLWYPAASTAGTAVVDVGGNFTVDATGGLRVNKGSASCSVFFDGSSPQALAVYGTNLSASYFSWIVNSGSTVDLNSSLYLGSLSSPFGGVTNNGTLVLTANGSFNGPANVLDAAGALFDVSQVAGGFTLAANQYLAGGGSVTGSVSVASSGVIHPGGGRTLTFKNNLTFNSGATNIFDLTSSTSSGNDQVVLNGSSPTLTAGGAQIVINSAGTLAPADYVLFQLTGGTISGSFNSTPAWMGTTPGNAASYSIVTSGSQVLLHYTSGGSGPGTFTNPPEIGRLTLSNGNVMFSGTGGQAGDAYYLLASTNLALPLNQWHTVATNILSASGTFTFTGTNVVNPANAGQFYLLSNTNFNP